MSIGHCGNGCDPVYGVKYGLQNCREVGCVCAQYGVCASWWRKIINVLILMGRVVRR